MSTSRQKSGNDSLRTNKLVLTDNNRIDQSVINPCIDASSNNISINIELNEKLRQNENYIMKGHNCKKVHNLHNVKHKIRQIVLNEEQQDNEKREKKNRIFK
jgi:hypothetical protein